MRKLTTDYGAVDIYRYYCKTTGNPRNLTQAQYSEITKKFFNEIINSMIYKGIEFSFGYRLGSIRIRKSKLDVKFNKEGKLDKRKFAPNWVATKKLWAETYPGLSMKELKLIKDKPIVYYLNKHTDGYRHKWHWDRSTRIAKNSTGYLVEVVRSADRKLAKALQDPTLGIDYSLF